MAAYSYSAGFYPDVRAAIGPEATDITVPDTVLGLPIFKGEAERFIMRNLTEAQYTDSRFTDEADYAATLYLASLVVLTIRAVESENLAGGAKMTYSKFDATKISADLLAKANGRIAEVRQAFEPIPTTISDNPNFFTVINPHRTEDDLISGAPENPFV